MAKLKLKGNGELDIIEIIVRNEMVNKGCDLIESIKKSFGSHDIYILLFEKFYLRINSRASLTVLIFQEDNQIIVEAISSGGGDFIPITLRAEDNFVNLVEKVLKGHGFVVIEEEEKEKDSLEEWK